MDRAEAHRGEDDQQADPYYDYLVEVAQRLGAPVTRCLVPCPSDSGDTTALEATLASGSLFVLVRRVVFILRSVVTLMVIVLGLGGMDPDLVDHRAEDLGARVLQTCSSL